MAKNNPDPLDTPSSFQVPSATGFSSPVAVLGTTHFTQLPISDSQGETLKIYGLDADQGSANGQVWLWGKNNYI